MTENGEELTEYELLRERNIQENQAKLRELGLIRADFSYDKPQPEKVRPIRRSRSLGQARRDSDPFTAMRERRRSTRLSTAKPVEFSKEVSQLILGNEENICSVNIKEEYMMAEKKPRKKTPEKRKRLYSGPREVPSVDDITEEDLKRIAVNTSEKIYSQDGTTCHQCRQKTLDTKTICRSSECFGIRGQFCGPCLKNRYGELVAEALKNPEWNCPPCRFLCNCSICRTQAGKMPTGQLTYYAQQQGFDSVKDFLQKEEKEDED